MRISKDIPGAATIHGLGQKKFVRGAMSETMIFLLNVEPFSIKKDTNVKLTSHSFFSLF